MNSFLNLYNDYIKIPIYFLIGLIYQIDYLFKLEINELYFDNNIVSENSDNKFNFIMTTTKNIDEIINNKNIFLKKYYINENEYLKILTLRENIPWSVDFYKPFHFLFLNNYLKTKSKLYTEYIINIKTSDLIIHSPLDNSEFIVENYIKKYYELIKLVLNNNESNNNFNDHKSLFILWKKPIEPSDIENYKKIINTPIEKKNIKINDIMYTDIKCYRNFIQKKFVINLKNLSTLNNDLNFVLNLNNNLLNMPFLYTTYRINQNNNDIITILY